MIFNKKKRMVLILTMIKKTFCVLILSVVLFMIPEKAWADDTRVATYEELQYSVAFVENGATILITKDIITKHAIIIPTGKEITIKSCDDNSRRIASNGNDYIFVTEENSSVRFEGIDLSSDYEGGVFYGSGRCSFAKGSIITASLSNNDAQKETNLEKTNNSPLELANFVISWSGFVFAFISIVAGIIAVFGIKEVHDLRTIREETKNIEKSVKETEEETKNTLRKLASKFETDAQSIMNGTYYYSLGVDYYKKAQYAKAITQLKKSTEYISKNTDAICLIGRAYTFIGKKNKAMDCYKDALSINANCVAAYRGLAAWYRYEDLSKALDYAKKATEIAPENTEVLNYYAQLLRDNDQATDALRVCLKSYNIQQHPDTDFFLSILYLSENSIGRAKSHIQKAIDEYQDELKYGVFKPVWVELAKWIRSIIVDEDPERFERAIIQLGLVNTNIDSEKTRTVVKGHVKYVLNALKQTDEYIERSINTLNGKN